MAARAQAPLFVGEGAPKQADAMDLFEQDIARELNLAQGIQFLSTSFWK